MTTPAWAANGNIITSSSAATLTPALPGSIVSGNLLLAVCYVKATGKAITVSAGWTIVGSNNVGGASAVWAYRVATGTDSAPVFSWTGSAGCFAEVFRYTNTLSVSPIDVNNSADATSATVTVGSLTTTVANDLIVLLLLTSSSLPPVPTDFTSRQGTGTLRLVDRPKNDAGATESVSVAITSGAWISFGIALAGSGASVGSHQRATQSVIQVLENYSRPTTVRATQVCIQVLRSQSSVTTPIPKAHGQIIG